MTWREQFREDNRLLFQLLGGWRGHVYLYVALLTFVHQVSLRYGACAGLGACAWSFSKGAIWALVWPFYWINYATGFILFDPYRW